MPKKPRDSRPSSSTSADAAADERLRSVAILAGACVAAGAAAYAMLLAAEPEPLSPVLRKIAREHNISFGDFRRKYLATSTPVIVDGWSTQPLLTRDDIVQSCGDDRLHDPAPRFRSNTRPARTRGLGCDAAQRRGARHLRDLLAAQGNRSFRMSDGDGRELSARSSTSSTRRSPSTARACSKSRARRAIFLSIISGRWAAIRRRARAGRRIRRSSARVARRAASTAIPLARGSGWQCTRIEGLRLTDRHDAAACGRGPRRATRRSSASGRPSSAPSRSG